MLRSRAHSEYTCLACTLAMCIHWQLQIALQLVLNRWHEMGEGADEKSCPNTLHGSVKHPTACGNCCVDAPTHGSNLAPVISKPLAVLALSSVVASKSRSDTSLRSRNASIRHCTGCRASACTNNELLINCSREYNYVTFYDSIWRSGWMGKRAM